MTSINPSSARPPSLLLASSTLTILLQIHCLPLLNAQPYQSQTGFITKLSNMTCPSAGLCSSCPSWFLPEGSSTSELLLHKLPRCSLTLPKWLPPSACRDTFFCFLSFFFSLPCSDRYCDCGRVAHPVTLRASWGINSGHSSPPSVVSLLHCRNAQLAHILSACETLNGPDSSCPCSYLAS